METLMIENGVITNNEVVVLITRPQMKTLFMEVTKPEMINLVTETIPKMNKTGNPYYGEIVKKSKCNFLLCTDYSKRVNVNRDKEDKEKDFVSQTPKGKKHLSPCVLTDEKTETKLYLFVERFDEIKPKVVIHTTPDDEFEMFRNFLPPISDNKSQGLDREVKPLTYLFDSIVSFSFRGRKFRVIE